MSNLPTEIYGLMHSGNLVTQNTYEIMTYAALMQDKEILDELTALRQCVLIIFILT